MSKRRLEAFSDSVIAVAITLLALNLPLPGPNTPHLADYLGRHWPSFAAFAVSFLTIGIVWVNHHAMVRRLVATDTAILFMNLVLLMTICVLPFTTALMAQYLRASSGQGLAAAIWSGSFLVMSLSFFMMQRHLMTVKADLLHEHVTPEIRRAVLLRNAVGLVPYAVATSRRGAQPLPHARDCVAVRVVVRDPGHYRDRSARPAARVTGVRSQRRARSEARSGSSQKAASIAAAVTARRSWSVQPKCSAQTVVLAAEGRTEVGRVIGAECDANARRAQSRQRMVLVGREDPQHNIAGRADVERDPGTAISRTSAGSSTARTPWSSA